MTDIEKPAVWEFCQEHSISQNFIHVWVCAHCKRRQYVYVSNEQATLSLLSADRQAASADIVFDIRIGCACPRSIDKVTV